MDTTGPTLQARALRSYRRLLILERVFQKSVWLLREQEANEAEATLGEGVRDMLVELAEDARIMSTVPLPFSEWRSDDGPQKGGWHTISQLECREVRQLVRAYEDLIDYCEMHSIPRPAEDRSDMDARHPQADYDTSCDSDLSVAGAGSRYSGATIMIMSSAALSAGSSTSPAG